MHTSARRLLSLAVAGSSALALSLSGLAHGAHAATHEAGSTSGRSCLGAIRAGTVTSSRQRVFAAAARTFHVPSSVLLGVSYMESRWDNHGAHPSTSAAYGPMGLTDLPRADLAAAQAGKGDPSSAQRPLVRPPGERTIEEAGQLTGLSVKTLKSDVSANICGGAALLASYQHQLGHPVSSTTSADRWYAAIQRYSGTSSKVDSAQFARRALTVIHHGESRVTNDGQRVSLAPNPAVAVPAAVPSSSSSQTDCPADLACDWVPAPYEWYGSPDPYAYGNHDIANRPSDMKINYIVIHDSETTYDEDMKLVQDPTYLAWNYTVRSSDGHVAQHLHANDVGWHAGNWYVNMHSIGIEHEGYAATGATWYTENMYESSADLVRYLAHEYGIPLDRAHIIGHDQVPGIAPGYTAGMHWDPGPYWNWQHYMSLLGAPLRPDRHSQSNVVTVDPSFHTNQQLVTGCDGKAADVCPAQGSNFVYLHTQPDAGSPLVPDVGLHPGGSSSTTYVSDWGARADEGQKVVVAQHHGDWLGVWWGGRLGWIHSPESDPVVLPSQGETVTPRAGVSSIPVYGRAYPEKAAYAQYDGNIPYQTVVPNEYSMPAGQSYVLADKNIQTDYYYAQTFQCQYAVDDCTDIQGTDQYYEIWFNHRLAYVRAADVTIQPLQH
jgi:N-acetyl-anhydromuramyl-L-alanine amidase AmpD